MRTDPALASAAPAEADWVEVELLGHLMRTARATQLLGVGLVPVFCAVLADDAPPAWLAAWVTLVLGAAGLRAWVLRQFAVVLARGPAPAQLAFFRRWRITLVAPALGWGLTIPLFFDHSPLADQFVCWLMIAGLAMFSINTLAAHLGTLRAYLDTLSISSLLLIGWHVGVQQSFRGPGYENWVALLLVLFWVALREAGRRQHATLRRNYELQYRNNQLIDSLTRQTQAALDAMEIKNRFLASAAHDIRQPVHALGLYADWLGAEPELVHEIAPRIVESTKAVNALFDSLFDVARLDSGKIRLDVGPVDLARLMHDLEVQFRPQAQARGLDFRVRPARGTAVSDAILLRRIAGNLVANAIKYTRSGGLLLALREHGGVTVLEVWDTGPGIPPAYEREVFREFFKVPAHAGTDDGFGLGLYIVARLAHILGHEVSLRSRVGRGTVFRLVLVPSDGAAAAARAAAAVSQLASMPWVRA